MRISNLANPVLYEPTSPVLLDFLRKWVNNRWYGKIDGLHKLPIFDGYFMLPKPCLEKFMTTQSGADVYTSPEMAFKTLDPLKDCNVDVILKTCQLHPILNDVAKRYDCNYVHLIRMPTDNFVSHLGHDLRQTTRLLAIAERKITDPRIDGAFWMKSIYEKASKKLGVTVPPNDYIGKFIIAWTYCNLEAIRQTEKSDRGLVVYFHNVVKNPKMEFIRMEKHLGVKFNRAYAGLIDVRKAHSAPDWLKIYFIERFKALGLWTYFKEIMGGRYEA